MTMNLTLFLFAIAVGRNVAFLLNSNTHQLQHRDYTACYSGGAENKGTDAFITNQLLRKMDEWTMSMEALGNNHVTGTKENVGTLFRDIVIDGVQRCFSELLSLEENDVIFDKGRSIPERTALELELRRSNQRLYKSLQQQLLEAEIDLANLQANMLKDPATTRFE